MLRADSPDQQNTDGDKEASTWTANILFVSAIHVLALISLVTYGPSWKTIALCLLQWQLASLGVTMGYHRLWAHKTFQASYGLRCLLAFLGTAAFQGSIKWWVFRHRLHHRFLDTENDPHNSKRGFWFSHIGWIFEKRRYPKAKLIDLSDLHHDPVIRFQHEHFIFLAGVSAFALPTFICWHWGDALGGLLYGGFVLRVLIWHSIFCINSIAHFYGSQEFSKTISARGNWVLALVAAGEGHHNFHHEFPNDYRNGISWFDYDPTKWAIYLASILGFAHHLKTVPDCLIEKARSSNKYGVKKLPPRMNLQTFQRSVCEGELYLIINGWVVDVGDYMAEHPGGHEILLSFIGHDATDAFLGGMNSHSHTALMLTEEHSIALLEE